MDESVNKNLVELIVEFKKKYPLYDNRHFQFVGKKIHLDNESFFDDFCYALEAFEKGDEAGFTAWYNYIKRNDKNRRYKAYLDDYNSSAALEAMKLVVDTKLSGIITKFKNSLDNTLSTINPSLDFYTQYKVLKSLYAMSDDASRPNLIRKFYALRVELQKPDAIKNTPKNLLDSVEHQILLHEPTLRTKRAIDAFFKGSAKGKKTTRLKEELCGERITADYFNGFFRGYGAFVEEVGEILDFVGLIPAVLLFPPVFLASLMALPFYYGFKKNENNKIQAAADKIDKHPEPPIAALDENIILTAKAKSTESNVRITIKAQDASVFKYSKKGPGFLAFFRPAEKGETEPSVDIAPALSR